jgi:hypothetical protein
VSAALGSLTVPAKRRPRPQRPAGALPVAAVGGTFRTVTFFAS